MKDKQYEKVVVDNNDNTENNNIDEVVLSLLSSPLIMVIFVMCTVAVFVDVCHVDTCATASPAVTTFTFFYSLTSA